MAHRWHDGSSRRTFLKRATAALTALGVLVTTPVWILKTSGDATASARPSEKGDSTLSEPLVAYVRNAAKGEVVLLVGTREVVRRDPELASLLVRCCEV